MKKLCYSIISKSYISAFFLMFLFCSLASAVTVNYSYDNLNRLSKVDYGNGSVIEYTYDAAGNRLSRVSVVDTTAPTGSISINSNATFINSITATLTLTCVDTNSCAQMQFSNDNVNWSDAENYGASKVWTLSAGEGVKTVYVKFKDNAGNWSIAYSDSITIDTTAPTNGSLTATAGTNQVSLSWADFSDAMSGIASYKLVYSTSETPGSCNSGTQIYSGTGSSFVQTDLPNGNTYYYRVCAVDNVGNVSSGATNNATIIIPEGFSKPQTDIGVEYLEREDGGMDSNNIDSSTGNPRVDIVYSFKTVFKDSSGNPPQYVKLYMTQRSNPTADNFYGVDMICSGNWATGATCSYSTLLGPAANHKFYFEAKLADNSTVRHPLAGWFDGPVTELLNGKNIVSVPRSLSTANMDGAAAFSSTSIHRYVSSGLTTDSNKGGYVAMGSSDYVNSGEGYYMSKNSSSLPEIGSLGDIADTTYKFNLKPGWNIVGNPYGGNVKLSDVKVQKGNENPVTWSDAATNRWIVNSIYYFKGSDWGSAYNFESAGGNPDARLVSWMGYWMYLNKDDDTYRLVITRP